LFLGQAVKPLQSEHLITPARSEMLQTAGKHYHEIWSFMRQVQGLKWTDALERRLAISFDKPPAPPTASAPDPRISWSSGAPGSSTGRYILKDPAGVVFCGFAAGSMPIDLGSLRVERLDTPFASLILVPANPAQTLDQADRLLLCVVGRGGNANMQWDAQRKTVSDHWGTAPPQIEPVAARLSLISPKPPKVICLTPAGAIGQTLNVTKSSDNVYQFDVGNSATLWYEIQR
jgi:hypothetical protein